MLSLGLDSDVMIRTYVDIAYFVVSDVISLKIEMCLKIFDASVKSNNILQQVSKKKNSLATKQKYLDYDK